MRVHLLQKEQVDFFKHIEETHHITYPLLANKLKVHVRTLSDWRRGCTTIPISTFLRIITLFDVPIPRSLEIIQKYWYTKIGAPLGGRATSNKYHGTHVDTEYRKQQWRIWWETSGKHTESPIGKRKRIKKFGKTIKVAELIGILLGDGHIDKYQLTVTLNAKDDKLFAHYVSSLLTEITGVIPSVTKRKEMNAVVVRLSRVEVIETLAKLGIKSGNKVKQQVDIPSWIKKSPRYMRACVRGLWDTDGCLFEEVHKKQKGNYRYMRMAFVNHSKPLLQSVALFLEGMDFLPKIRNNRCVSLETKVAIVKYFKLIGSHNKKHLVRYAKFTHTEGCESGLSDLS